MSEEKSSIEVGEGKFKIEAKDGVIERASNQFLDLVSPFSEIAGAIGDAARMYRQQNAIRALNRAKQIAQEQNIDLKPVPPKFLVSWLEGVSLEEEKELNLPNFWANLLINASKNFQSGHILFSRILKEMTNSEADLLKRIAHADGSEIANIDDLRNATITWKQLENPKSQLVHLDLNGMSSDDYYVIFNRLKKAGLGVEYLAFTHLGDNLRTTLFATEHADRFLTQPSDYMSAEILISLGLIEEISITYRNTMENYQVTGAAYCITELGVLFYSTCSPTTVETDEYY